jgi:hypothetical protein
MASVPDVLLVANVFLNEFFCLFFFRECVLQQICCVCYCCYVPRKTITANVSLPPEIHAWVKGKIAAILEVQPAANPTFTSVVSDALRRAMRDEELQLQEGATLDTKTTSPTSPTKTQYKPARKSNKPAGS